MNEKLKKYSKTENFEVVDTVGVPHPYCITPKHISAATGGILDEYAIEQAEKKGAKCGTKGCTLSFREHQHGLFIKCKVEDQKALHEYLMSIKDMAEADGYVGFAFIKGW